jgi:hypothetical protein
MNNGTTFTQWQPTAQFAWIRQEDGSAILCQLWMEGYGVPQGFQPTGNARWEEVPTIDAPKQIKEDEPEQLQLVF